MSLTLNTLGTSPIDTRQNVLGNMQILFGRNIDISQHIQIVLSHFRTLQDQGGGALIDL